MTAFPVRIYFVDDESHLIELLQTAIDSSRYTIHGQSHPQEALNELKDLKTPPDLLVTDYFMPQMTGLDLIREVRTFYPNLPALLATGHFTSDLEEELAHPELGRVHLLHKPYRRQEFTEKIDKILNI